MGSRSRLNVALAGIMFLAWSAGTGAHSTPHGQDQRPFDESKAEEKAFGHAADPRGPARVVRIEMSDAMRFKPALVTVKRGEAVRFEAVNRGKANHEMVLGTMAELKEHAELMRGNPGMEHDEPHMLHVAPGKRGAMTWRFTRAGEFHFGCLEPGHFEAGMVGRINVTER